MNNALKQQRTVKTQNTTTNVFDQSIKYIYIMSFFVDGRLYDMVRNLYRIIKTDKMVLPVSLCFIHSSFLLPPREVWWWRAMITPETLVVVYNQQPLSS